MMIESLLLTAARVSTFEQRRLLTNASGFFFERDGRLFLVTSRHVMIDEASILRTADRQPINPHGRRCAGRLADADRHALAFLAAGADAGVEAHVVADHRDAGQHVRAVADQVAPLTG
jgi:hypothetical protein